MTINLRRDAWKDDRQYDDVRTLALEIERLQTLTSQRKGVWVPTMTFGGSATGITYNAQSGGWLKQGELVLAWGFVNLTNNGTGSGQAQILGLPFTIRPSIAGADIQAHAGITYFSGIAVALDSLFLLPRQGEKAIDIFQVLNGGTTTAAATETQLGNTFATRFFVPYMTDDP